MEYQINYGSPSLPPELLEEIKKRKNATYIGDFCVKTKNGGWSERSISIFYCEIPPNPEYSKYFGIFLDHLSTRVMITDGSSAFSEPITGIASSTGEVVYSRNRHDYRSLANGEGCIDGGRDYLRMLGGSNGRFPSTVELKIEGPKLVVTKVLSEVRQAPFQQGDAC